MNVKVRNRTARAPFPETQERRRGHRFVPPVRVREATPLPGEGPEDGPTVWAKWFSPTWTWYATEVDWSTGDAFGFVDGDDGEWGYFNLRELEAVRAGWIIVERDCWWEPTPADEALRKVLR
jgi:hypothetical protein